MDLMQKRESAALTDGQSYGKGGPALDQTEFQKAITSMLGPPGHMHTAPLTSVNLDLKEGFAHSTTGIPYAIHGTASVISKKITDRKVGSIGCASAVCAVCVVCAVCAVCSVCSVCSVCAQVRVLHM